MSLLNHALQISSNPLSPSLFKMWRNYALWSRAISSEKGCFISQICHILACNEYGDVDFGINMINLYDFINICQAVAVSSNQKSSILVLIEFLRNAHSASELAFDQRPRLEISKN